jgi:hypothetical protein
MCVKTYMSFGKKIWGEKPYGIEKKEGNGCLRNWLVAYKLVARFCPLKERRIADKERG